MGKLFMFLSIITRKIQRKLKKCISYDAMFLMMKNVLNMFLSFSNKKEGQTINQADVVLVEGILVFYFREIRELFHMKLFVDSDADIRLAKRGNCFGNYIS